MLGSHDGPDKPLNLTKGDRPLPRRMEARPEQRLMSEAGGLKVPTSRVSKQVLFHQ